MHCPRSSQVASRRDHADLGCGVLHRVGRSFSSVYNIQAVRLFGTLKAVIWIVRAFVSS